MNYNDVHDLEFGAANTKIDPAVLSGKLQLLTNSQYHLIDNLPRIARRMQDHIHLKSWNKFLGQDGSRRRPTSRWYTAILLHQGHVQRTGPEHASE